MEIAEKLESIENKIENYNEKIDNISSLITTLIHSFEKTQLSKVKSEIIAKIEEKLSDNSSFPDVEEMKSVFSQIKDDFAESQSALKLKIVELEKTIKKISTTVSDVNKTEIDSVDASQLSNIEEILKSLSDKINNFNIAADAQTTSSTVDFPVEKIDAITTLITAQNNANKTLFDNLENHIKALDANLTYLSNSTSNSNDETVVPSANISGIDEIKDRFDELNLSITSVLSAIKVIDKKYVELKNFQEVIDKLTTDVVSPILLASNEIKAFVNQTSDNFSAINDFVKEYNHDAFTELQSNIQNVNDNVDKLSIDVSHLCDLVNEFKTNSDLSNHTISDNMEKIENMISEYKTSLTDLTQNATADAVKEGVKSLNDEFYMELLNLFNSLSFDNETEDIKDFMENIISSVNVKTDENSEKLNNIMLQFKNLLHKVEGIERTQNSISDYLKPEETDELMYSFDDIQNDLAKMRLVLNDISKSVSSSEVVDEISAKIKQTGEQIENFSQLISSSNENDENVAELKAKLEELNSQVYDISLRTNKLILSNEDSNIELKNNLELFKDVFEKANPQKLYELFYELTNYFNDVNEKIAVVTQTTQASHEESVTIKNALVYVGEWLDKATTVLEEIRSNTEYSGISSDNNTGGVLEKIQNNLDNLINGRNENALILKEVANLQKSISKNTNIILTMLKNNEDVIEKRFVEIDEKINQIIEFQDKAPKATTKASTTQLKSVEKRIAALEGVLNKISDKLLKE